MGDDGEKAYRPYRDNAGIEVARAPVQLIVHVLCMYPLRVALSMKEHCPSPVGSGMLRSSHCGGLEGFQWPWRRMKALRIYHLFNRVFDAHQPSVSQFASITSRCACPSSPFVSFPFYLFPLLLRLTLFVSLQALNVFLFKFNFFPLP